MSGGGKAGDYANQEAAAATKAEADRQSAIKTGTDAINTTFSKQFTPDYFQKQADAYTNYAEPQLNDQFGNATKQLTYALDRAGNLNSSTRGFQSGQLQKLYDTYDQQIKDQAVAQEGQDKSAVQTAQQNLINSLNATGDATGAANSATAQAAALSTPAAYSPLTNLFTDFTNQLGTSAAAAKAYAYSSGMAPSLSPAMFAQSGAATSVTR
jgi:hypothetical protein